MNVVFENENFVVLDKPSNQLSIPGRFETELDSGSLLTELTEKYKRHIFVVHRLDREVSGLIVYAKNDHAHAVACNWFEHRTVEKQYEALSESADGKWPNVGEKFKWESMLLKGKKRAYEKPFGKRAITEAEFLGVTEHQGQTVGRWKLIPKTGRSHQLRFELFKRGFPILGDALYGAKGKFQTGIALRAISLNFSHCREAKEYGLKPDLQVNSAFSHC